VSTSGGMDDPRGKDDARPMDNACKVDNARVVVDTNAVLDWLIFDDPRVQSLVRAIEGGVLRLVTSADCQEELRRVLAYRYLKLDEAAQAAAMARYLAQAEMFDAFPAAPSGLPLCTDCDDQKFLEVAWHAGARWLVTKDKALLSMARRVAKLDRFTVIQPQAFEAGLLSKAQG
jgi:putative PIN family toxin of toxin-antitoxin system